MSYDDLKLRLQSLKGNMWAVSVLRDVLFDAKVMTKRMDGELIPFAERFRRFRTEQPASMN